MLTEHDLKMHMAGRVVCTLSLTSFHTVFAWTSLLCDEVLSILSMTRFSPKPLSSLHPSSLGGRGGKVIFNHQD